MTEGEATLWMYCSGAWFKAAPDQSRSLSDTIFERRTVLALAPNGKEVELAVSHIVAFCESSRHPDEKR